MTRSTMSECEAIMRRMWPHLDGALSDEERVRVVRHLTECDACRSHYKFAESFLDAVHHAKPSDAEFARVETKVLSALAAAGFAG